METNKTITEEEIQQALRSFKMDGGLIKKLPKEIVPPALLVGKKYGRYENIMEHYLTGEFSAPF
ncbi:MAG: hypothetical protein V3S64_05645 [bacterium]